MSLTIGQACSITMICKNCGELVEHIGLDKGYWKHKGRPIGGVWCDKDATQIGTRAEPIAGESR